MSVASRATVRIGTGPGRPAQEWSATGPVLCATGMSSAKLPKGVATDLRRRHVEFLRERLVSDAACEDWKRLARRGWETLVATRVRDLVDARTAARAVASVIDAESVRGLFAPVLREVARQSVSALRRDPTKLGDYVPDDARAAVDELLERHDLVPDDLVREVFEQKVVEDAISNTLYDAITQFQSTVNPFFAEWGLPSIIKRVPIGGGMILSSMESLRAEFDRRVEPEIRKFLAVFSRRTKSELAELFLSNSGDPKLAKLRKDLVAYLYTRTVKELLAGLDEEMTETGAFVAERVTLRIVERPESAASLEAALVRLLEEHGDRTVGEWLERTGASQDAALEAWAEASWPLVRGVLSSGPVVELLEQLAAEFYEGIASED